MSVIDGTTSVRGKEPTPLEVMDQIGRKSASYGFGILPSGVYWKQLRTSIKEQYGSLKNEVCHALIDFNHGDIEAGKHRLMLVIDQLEKMQEEHDTTN